MGESTITFLIKAWDVLVLFLIPIGGGIPGGVLLAKSKALEWPIMMILYFISDVILACCFEPFLLLVVAIGKRSSGVARFSELVKQSTRMTIARYGTNLNPPTLVMIAFGVDPMTGRAATAVAGHGFITGWLLAIIGDMFYFSVIMICTLWLSDILGDGTVPTLIILAVMIVVPILIRKFRERRLKI